MTPVEIGELVVEASAAPAEGAGEPPAEQDRVAVEWEEVERVRRAEAQLVRDRLRTRAEGFDA